MYIGATAFNDDAKRMEIYKEMYKIIWDDAAYIPLYYAVGNHIMNSNLDVSYIAGTGIVQVYNMSWK